MTTRLSLQARLVIVALVTSLTILALATWRLRANVTQVMETMLNTKLDAQIDAFTKGLRHAPPERSAFLVEFSAAHPRYGWRITSRDRVSGGGTGFGPVVRVGGDPQEHEGILSGVATAASGETLRVRSRERDGTRIDVAAPASIVTEPTATTMRSTWASIVALGLAMVFTAWLQLRTALRPIRRLRDAIADIRTGALRQLPEEQPIELRPLAVEMNALLAQNEAGLASARRHAANLAHGLKTPLAALALRLRREGASAGAGALVAELDGRIEHHLRRARAAATSVGGRAQADVGEVAGQIVNALRHLHPGRRIDQTVATDMIVAMDRQDLDEMLGNLLDNACRHAGAQVRLSCRADGLVLSIVVEDDGPGVAEERMAAAFASGVRLDESGRGHGFGLGICHELAELYGGSLRLDRSSELGGLQAMVALPRR